MKSLASELRDALTKHQYLESMGGTCSCGLENLTREQYVEHVIAAATEGETPAAVELEPYDAGLLANSQVSVEEWQNRIRYYLQQAHEHYQAQVAAEGERHGCAERPSYGKAREDALRKDEHSCKYRQALEKHLCHFEISDWLVCAGGHEDVCLICLNDRDKNGHAMLCKLKRAIELALKMQNEAWKFWDNGGNAQFPTVESVLAETLRAAAPEKGAGHEHP